jgi:hypothetical protein
VLGVHFHSSGALGNAWDLIKLLANLIGTVSSVDHAVELQDLGLNMHS